MYTAKVPSYEIDLNQDEADRWAEVIKAERRVAIRLAKEASGHLPGAMTTLAGPIFKMLYGICGGRFVGEIGAWAQALGVSSGHATMLNCTYELSHVSLRRIFGCTAGARWVSNWGMVHVRNMDWPLSSLGDATRLFWFRKGRHRFVTVGMPGFVGAISGMVPHRYSVTINWAPPNGRPKFDFGPAFLLREVLENCKTFDDAVYCLKRTVLSTPVFFLVCGTERGQACVIERTQAEAAVRKMTGSVIVQANHHIARKFMNRNAGDDWDDSEERFSTLKAGLVEIGDGPVSLDDIAATLDREPVLNESSYQQMAFCPLSGTLRVWRWVTGNQVSCR